MVASAAKQTERQETSDIEFLEMMCAHFESDIEKHQSRLKAARLQKLEREIKSTKFEIEYKAEEHIGGQSGGEFLSSMESAGITAPEEVLMLMGGADAKGKSYMHEEYFTFKQQKVLDEVGTTAKNKNGERELMSVEQVNM